MGRRARRKARGGPGPLRVVAVGGFDPSGRAGVLADVATLRARGAQALAVVTCLTAQGTAPRTWPVDIAVLKAQLKAVADAGRLDAVKVGVVPHRRALEVIARWLRRLEVPAVVDPVTITSSGLRLSTLTPKDFGLVARKSTVLTPNRDEAAALQRLRGFGAVVVKSFSPGEDAVFIEGKRPIWLKARALPRSGGHRGTGCRFASALAVELAKGHTVAHAARAAKQVVRKFLRAPILLPVSGASRSS